MVALNRLHGATVLESDRWSHLSTFSTLYVLHVHINGGRPPFRVLDKGLLCPLLGIFLLTCSNGSGMHELFVHVVEFRASNEDP